MITASLLYIYLIPLFISIILTLKKFSEKITFQLTLLSFFSNFFFSLVLSYYYFLDNFKSFELSLGQIHFDSHHFSFNFYFDELTFIILLMTGYLSLLVSKFSFTYLHREIYFQRFFIIINLFVFGLTLLATAGTLDLLFAGWELVGLSSFLLIGFYFDRTRPTRNAFRIFSIYRLCDVGLLFSAILSHALIPNADHFYNLIHQIDLAEFPLSNEWLILMQLLIILAAIGKSGQFPFINWPARAMEGPTPSSAIFYGALSIHCGVFLLYRTYPLFANSPAILVLLFGIGLFSTILATGIGRIQANIKGQIAYASVAQIGIMLMELALGLKVVVLVHLVLHAMLRCYQILISPSIIVDHIKNMDETTRPSIKKSLESYLPLKLRATLFTFAQQEGFLSISERGFFPIPLITIKIWIRNHIQIVTMIFVMIAMVLFYKYEHFKFELTDISAHLFSVADLFLSIYCLMSLKHPKQIWRYFILAQICFVLSNFLYDPDRYQGIILYLLSAIPCLILGLIGLSNLPDINLKKYNGLHNLYPTSYRLLIIAFIGLSGYPLSTIFWAEDIIFAEILLHSPSILIMTAMSLMLNGLIIGKILVKTFWGHPRLTYK